MHKTIVFHAVCYVQNFISYFMGRHNIEGVWLKAPWEIFQQMREEVTERKKGIS